MPSDHQLKPTLRRCPCCGSEPMPILIDADGAKIACKRGCLIVEGVSEADAVKLWNEPRFTDK